MQVVSKIKSNPLQCELLVISEEGAKWYELHDIAIDASLPNIIRPCEEVSFLNLGIPSLLICFCLNHHQLDISLSYFRHSFYFLKMKFRLLRKKCSVIIFAEAVIFPRVS